MSSAPRVLLIGGNDGRWSAADKRRDAPYMNGVESWVFATDGDYVNFRTVRDRDIAGHDVIICNTNAWRDPRHCGRFRTMAENRPPHVRWMTLLEGDMRDYLQPAEHIRELFNASDIVNCINRHATSLIQLLTTSRVEYLGIPHPSAAIRQLATPMDRRERRIHICPMLLDRWSEYHVARSVGIEAEGYERTISRKFSNIFSNWRKFGVLLDKNRLLERGGLYDNARLSIRQESWFTAYFQRAGMARVWLNLDDRYTWGRHVLDAAALGVPIVTTRSTGHGEELFPRTTVMTEFEIGEAIRLTKQLFEDDDFYGAVVERSQQGLERYAPDAMRDELFNLLESVDN